MGHHQVQEIEWAAGVKVLGYRDVSLDELGLD